MDSILKWIWQHHDYPSFPYTTERLEERLSTLLYTTGKLEGAIMALNDTNLNGLMIDTAIEEIVKSSEIEGEILSRESVKSSVRKKLDDSFDLTDDSSSHHTDGLVTLLLDSSEHDKPLTHARLHSWHAILFPTGYSDGHKIDVAQYRKHEMSVVSMKGYRETVHYVATPPQKVEAEMNKLLEYIEHSSENPYIKSAIVHLWFVSIHPYDDGNGRIARTLTNYILSKELGLNHKYYSLSSVIRTERKSYYTELEKAQNLFYNRTFTFDAWILWHSTMIQKAMDFSIFQIQIVIQKTIFWDRARAYPLNKRELKVLNKILDIGIENFEGGLSTKKYAGMTHTSIPTAKRDISELLDYGLIRLVEGSAGRNTRYTLAV